MTLRVLAVVVAVAWVVPAQAQSVKVDFRDGRVSVIAQNAPLRVILDEWARLGGATIVNADRLVGPPLTLELTAVTERQALDTLLRNAAGYMLAPRRPGTTGASMFDRILILPTSVGPRTPTNAGTTVGTTPRPVLLPRPPTPAAIGDGPNEDPADQDAAGAAAPRPVVVQRPAPQPDRPLPETGDEPRDTPDGAPAARPTPNNPFGVPAGSSSLPGVISPAGPPAAAPQGR
jgi:hypothetical protein